MDQTVLADVQIARSRPAAPVVGLSVDKVVLKVVHPGVPFLPQVLHLQVDLALFPLKRLHRPQTIVDDTQGAGETQFHRPIPYGQGVLRILDATADHGIDIDLEVRQLGEP